MFSWLTDQVGAAAAGQGTVSLGSYVSITQADLRITVEHAGTEPGESSDVVRARVAAAVERQKARLRDTPWRRNAHIPAGALERYLALGTDARQAWIEECEVRELTGRGAARIRRVARTVADLADHPEIDAADIGRAAWMREDLW